MKRIVRRVVLIVSVMVSASLVQAQRKCEMMCNLGVALGEKVHSSVNVGIDFQYNVTPYLGFMARLDTYHTIGKMKNERVVHVIEGKYNYPRAGEEITNFTNGALLLYGVGITCNIFGFWETLSQHTLALAGGVGWVHAYAAVGEPPDYILGFYNSGGVGFFSTLRYKCLVTEHLSVGTYSGCIIARTPQISLGLILCAEF